MVEGQLCWENRNLIIGENLKLAMAQKPTPSSSILVMYVRLNQGEWICSLCGGSLGQQRLNITALSAGAVEYTDCTSAEG